MNMNLKDSSNNYINPGWRGLRLNMALGYNF